MLANLVKIIRVCREQSSDRKSPDIVTSTLEALLGATVADSIEKQTKKKTLY